MNLGLIRICENTDVSGMSDKIVHIKVLFLFEKDQLILNVG